MRFRWGRIGEAILAFLVLALLCLVIVPYVALLNTFPWLVCCDGTT
jgi:hypothetical protein